MSSNMTIFEEKSICTQTDFPFIRQTNYLFDDIGQFLSDEFQKHETSLSIVYQQNQTKEKGEKSELSDKNKRLYTNSFNRNCQKHTVLTVKLLTSMDEFRADSQQNEIIRKMWNIFLKSQKKNKEILEILFGQAHIDSQRDQKLFQNYGFGQFLKLNGQLLNKCQNMLRLSVVRQMSIQTVQSHILKRRMSQKSQFLSYLNAFLQQISAEPLKNRLNNWRKQKI